MWNLSVAWHELVFRAISIFSFLFIVFRLWGRKHFGQLTPFDLILLLIMSEAVQNALVGDDKGVPAVFITLGTLLLLNICLNKLSFHSRRAEKIIEGSPTLLVYQGKAVKEAMAKETVTDRELHEAMRQQGVAHIKDVGIAMLETNGEISIVRQEDFAAKSSGTSF